MNYIKKMKNAINVLLTAGFGLLLTSLVHAKDLPGAAPTSWGVSNSGAFNFQIPIVIPQGTNGMQPNLAFTYTSGGGNGSMGVGWNISGLGAITRCGRTLATDGIRGGVLHDPNDRFCLNGKRLILSSGTYGATNSEYRTEVEEFTKIVATGNWSKNVNGGTTPAHFLAWRKDGTKVYYGLDINGRFVLPGTTSVHAWKVSRVYDRNHNHYNVSYNTGDGYVDEINYTINALGLLADKKIKFNYQQRPDTRTRYIQGKAINMNRRLTSVEVTKGSDTIREYNIAYETAPVSQRSRVLSIEECGLNGTCMPVIPVAYKTDTKGFTNATRSGDKAKEDMLEYYTYNAWVGNDTPEVGAVKEINKGAWVDLNGDGRVDQVIAYKPPSGPVVNRVYLKNADGSWSADKSVWHLRKPLRSYENGITNMTTARFRSNVINQGQLVDVNGDGLPDVVYAYQYITEVTQYDTDPRETVLETYLNNGNGWDPDPSAAYAPKDILFDYATNGSGNERVETIRGRLLDINGDGLVDWVRAYHDYKEYGYNGILNGVHYKKTWINNGTGWTHDPDYRLDDVFVEYRGPYRIQRGEFVDVNGDGLVDWVQAFYRRDPAPKTNIKTLINTGTSFVEDSSFKAPEVIYTNIAGWDDRAATRRGNFVDVNGDGLADWVRSYNESTTATFLNNGNGGWVPSGDYKPPFVHMDHTNANFTTNWPLNVRGVYRDFNGDGLVDYVQSYKSSADNFPVSKRAWRNTGSGWQEEVGTPHVPTELYFDYSWPNDGKPENAKSRFGSFVDINSDGRADWVKSRVGVTPKTRLSRLSRADQVESITTTMGVVVKPTLSPLTSESSLYVKAPTLDNGQTLTAEADSLIIQSPTYVISTLKTSRPDSELGYNQIDYKYAGAQVHRRGRGFLGFKQRTVIDYQSGITQTQEFNQAYPFTGTTHVSKAMENGQVISETNNTYQQQNLPLGNGNHSVFVYLDTQQSRQWELASNGGQQFSRVTQDFDYDDFGNVDLQTTTTYSGQGVQLNQTVVDNEFRQDIGRWLLSLLETVTSTSSGGASTQPITRVNKFTYDNRGRVDLAIREPNGGDLLKLTTDYDYDGYGNVTDEKLIAPAAGNQRNSVIGYDLNQHRLPVTLTNAKGQQSTIDYHPQCDQPELVTDINGQKSRYGYDDFCRQTLSEVVDPNNPSGDGLFPSTTYYSENPNNLLTSCLVCQTTAKLAVTTQSAGEASVTTYFNRYAQPLKSTTTGMLGESIAQFTQYNERGQVKQVSQPYFYSILSSPDSWTIYQYDALNRVTNTTLPFDNGSSPATVSQVYGVSNVGHRQATTSNTLNNPTTTVVNALGQVEQVIDAHSKTMSYQYDATGNLVETTDAADTPNHIVVGYDTIGRRTSLNDPDMGNSIYVYDAFGDLRSQTDAKGQEITLDYDELSRLIERNVPGTPGKSGGKSVWEYDTALNGIGAIAAMAGPSQTADPLSDTAAFKKTFSYDELGRPSADATRIIGKTYTQAYNYNADGFLDSRKYPDSGNNGELFAVKYNYLNGYLSSISGLDENGNVCIEHWKADKYDALGRVKQETLGTIVQTTRGFKPGQNVLETIQSKLLKVNPDQVVQNLSYTYDANNNLESRHDTMITNSVMETFTYDDLDRLRFHHKGSATTEVRYDAIGNIKYKSDVGSYSYNTNGVRPHAVKRVNKADPSLIPWHKFEVNVEWEGTDELKKLPNIHNQNFVYDGNGNITKSGDRRVSWTAFDKPSRMYFINADSTQKGSSIRYGANFERIWKREATFSAMGSNAVAKETTTYIGKDYERITDSQGEITHRYTISTGSNSIQIDRAHGTEIDKPRYLLGDNLGSTNVIMNAAASVEQRLGFDPWGLRTNVGDPTAVNSMTNKGYTGHEMDDEVGLINMNARIYDPYLGRFLSADPVLPDAQDMQSYNRYSYVTNNPLKYVDPTGNNLEEIVVTGARIGSGGWLNYFEISGNYDSGSGYADGFGYGGIAGGGGTGGVCFGGPCNEDGMDESEDTPQETEVMVNDPASELDKPIDEIIVKGVKIGRNHYDIRINYNEITRQYDDLVSRIRDQLSERPRDTINLSRNDFSVILLATIARVSRRMAHRALRPQDFERNPFKRGFWTEFSYFDALKPFYGEFGGVNFSIPGLGNFSGGDINNLPWGMYAHARGFPRGVATSGTNIWNASQAVGFTWGGVVTEGGTGRGAYNAYRMTGLGWDIWGLSSAMANSYYQQALQQGQN